MPFKKILCATDFSAGSELALRTAAHLAAESAGELTILHVWHLPAVASSADAFAPPLYPAISDAAATELAHAEEHARLAGAPDVTLRLANGMAWREITDLLGLQAFDLCVVGTHGRTGLGRVLLGSVAEKVVRHAPCSVLAVRDAEPQPYRTVLCPVDFSESSRFAMLTAASLTAPGGLGITLLHVIEPPVMYAGRPLDTPYMQLLETQAREELARWEQTLRTLTSVDVRTSVRIGTAGAAVLDELDERPAIDLVVMGSEGRTGLSRIVLGSVAEKVVRHARTPVLVARRRA